VSAIDRGVADAVVKRIIYHSSPSCTDIPRRNIILATMHLSCFVCLEYQRSAVTIKLTVIISTLQDSYYCLVIIATRLGLAIPGPFANPGISGLIPGLELSK
jgi:hypothetical protein